MTETAAAPTVVPVNARVTLPAIAAQKLAALYRQAQQAQEVTDVYLHGVCAGLGVDRERVVGFDDATGELVMDEADPERIDSIGS